MINTQVEKEANKMTPQPSSTKKRLVLLSATYITGVIILEVISRAQVHNFPNSKDDLMMSLIAFMLSIVFLPAGLFQALAIFLYRTLGIYVDLIVTDLEQGSLLGVVFAGISYLIFLGIVRAALLTKNQRTFRILYYIFIGLLAIDIGGCTVI